MLFVRYYSIYLCSNQITKTDMIITPPAEVLAAVLEDLKSKRLTQEEIAAKTGYKTRQAVSAILSSNKYMTKSQASRFSQAFGYYYDYLTSGIGSLMSPEEDNRPAVTVFPKMVLLLRPFDSIESFKEAFNTLLDSVLATYGEKTICRFLAGCLRYISYYTEWSDEDIERLVSRRQRQYARKGYSLDVQTQKDYFHSEKYYKECERMKEMLLQTLYRDYLTMQEQIE